jgi:RNA recognition motif-containing protein
MVKDDDLMNFFKSKYSSVHSPKVIVDAFTKLSRGYGFIKFNNLEEFQKALMEINGYLLFGKQLRVK